jgi:N-acetylneuraminic acid mutarotase
MLMGGLFCLGGCDNTDTVYGDWVKRSDFDGVSRSDASSFTIGTNGYLYGGYDGKNRLSDLWEYNTVDDYWTQKATCPGPGRSGATAFSLDNMGYVGTGFDGEDYMKDFWQYNPSTNTWTQKADFGGTARYGALSFGVSGKGYMGTGYDDNYLKDIWQYDPTGNTWSLLAGFSGSKRKGATTFVLGTKAYIVCGENNGSYVADCWYYDASTSTWSARDDDGTKKANVVRKISNLSDQSFDDDYNITRANGLAMVINGKVYLSCGESGTLRADTWIYDPANDQWTASSAFEGTTRTGAVVFSTGTHGYIATGRSSTYRFDDMWEFLPDAEYDQTNN